MIARPAAIVVLAVAALFALSLACDEATPVPVDTVEPRPTESPVPTAESTQEAPVAATATPTRVAVAPTSLPERPTAVATPTAEASPEPGWEDYVLKSVEPAPTMCSPPDLSVVVPPSPTPISFGEDMESGSTDIVQVDFPEWVDDCPQMAYQIANADVIVRANWVSIDSEIVAEANESLGYSVDLIYTFAAEEYLKGDGPEDFFVRQNSGPAADLDIIYHRSEGQARSLASSWSLRMGAIARENAVAILFLYRQNGDNDYGFRDFGAVRGKNDSPDIGTTWLAAVGESEYRHQFAGGLQEKISSEELKSRIEDLRPFVEGEYGACVRAAFAQRTRVREQVLGTLRQLTLGGYGDPWPFPKFEKTASQGEALINVFKAERPAYPTPRFSHYWFDGEFRNRFGVYTNFEFGASFESFHATYVLPPGQYSVYYNQYHQSLPCAMRRTHLQANAGLPGTPRNGSSRLLRLLRSKRGLTCRNEFV